MRQEYDRVELDHELTKNRLSVKFGRKAFIEGLMLRQIFVKELWLVKGSFKVLFEEVDIRLLFGFRLRVGEFGGGFHRGFKFNKSL